MRSHFRTVLAVTSVLGMALLASAPAEAGGTKKKHLHTFEHFDAGETEGAAIEGSGKITTGYQTEGTDLKAGTGVFSCLPTGKDLLVGTSDKATVQRLKSGKKGLDQEVLAELPGAVVELTDLAGDDDHWAARVTAPQFAGKTRVAQHKMVYAAFGEKMGGELHALQVTTVVPK